ncbi:LCP family protein [Crystallibacter degradans]|jgi:LCP family protein required for cell wall assembly|uniref:LCP family protein n=1 Tax=Crystallibacter degradans TaxID=2726743 RepID=UPI0014727750|nr:LCP family protein [Arthrobacter sp. SF27]NMR28282.1 LytR family transcriptional regulator [Arthrobacter sp. SF27]
MTPRIAPQDSPRRGNRGDDGYGVTDPVRYPQSAPAPVRTKRAFILLLLTLFIPGSAQLVAGNRSLGHKALRVTFTVWALLIAAGIVALVNWPTLVNIATHPWGSLILVIVLAALALFWGFLFLDTLRIIRPGLLAPGMRPIVAVCLVALMALTTGTLGYGAYLMNVGRSTLGTIFETRPAFDPVDGRYNFLLMGGDAGAGRVGLRPDSIQVVSVDAKTGQTVMFGIPRNFQNAPFPEDSPMHAVYPEGFNCGDECIINALYVDVEQNHADLYPDAKNPGAEAMKDAVSGILGIEIQAYALVDMGGFEALVDAMGGITVDAGGWVPISDRTIPGTNQHYPPKGWIAPGVQELDGYHALWYARSREFATDYDRVQRQQCVMSAMVKQLDPATVLTRFQQLASAGEEVVETDIPSEQLGSFVSLAADAKGQKIKRLTIGPPDFGTPSDNFVTFPDFSQIHPRVQEMFIQEEETKEAGGDAGSKPDSGSDSGAGENNDGGADSGGTAEDTSANDGGAEAAPAETPAEQTPEITEEYLQQLAVIGDSATLSSIVRGNGECSVP